MFNRWTVCLTLTAAFSLVVGYAQQAPGRGRAPAARGQAPVARVTGVPRMPDGKPNLTGLWQALGTAYWDIRDHSAQAGPFFQLGATGAMPAGQGIVEGGDIPYKPA